MFEDAKSDNDQNPMLNEVYSGELDGSLAYLLTRSSFGLNHRRMTRACTDPLQWHGIRWLKETYDV